MYTYKYLIFAFFFFLFWPGKCIKYAKILLTYTTVSTSICMDEKFRQDIGIFLSPLWQSRSEKFCFSPVFLSGIIYFIFFFFCGKPTQIFSQAGPTTKKVLIYSCDGPGLTLSNNEWVLGWLCMCVKGVYVYWVNNGRKRMKTYLDSIYAAIQWKRCHLNKIHAFNALRYCSQFNIFWLNHGSLRTRTFRIRTVFRLDSADHWGREPPTESDHI